MRSAKLFVYPSLNEGFGFPPLEAMSVGCPVLASRVPSIPEVCAGCTVLLRSRGSRLIRSRTCCGRSTTRRHANGRWSEAREVAAQYSWEQCGQETLALYRECQ